MRRLLLTAVSVTATTSAYAGIPAGIPASSPRCDDRQGKILGDAVATESQTAPASATLAFFDSAYQQLLQGGANQ